MPLLVGLFAAILNFGSEVPLSTPTQAQSSPRLLNADGTLIAIWTDVDAVRARGRNGSTAVLIDVPTSAYQAAAANLLWIATEDASAIYVRRYTLDLVPLDRDPIVIHAPASSLMLGTALAAAGDDLLVAWG